MEGKKRIKKFLCASLTEFLEVLLVLARNLSRKIGALEIFDDAIEVVEQMLMVP